MNEIKVAVPVFRGRNRFHVLKGRAWSPVEHLILQALTVKERTSAELAEQSRLPRRVIIEILIRLMRVGWVEITPMSGAVSFSATDVGRQRGKLSELPTAPKASKLWRAFFVDRVFGTSFRGTEFYGHTKAKIEEKQKREAIVVLQPTSVQANPRDFYDCLADEDERIDGMDPNPEHLNELFLLVSVRGEHIEGLPSRAPHVLKRAILNAAKASGIASGASAVTLTSPPGPVVVEVEDEPVVVPAVCSLDDMILGGTPHREALIVALKKARTRVIIHSTFVSADSIREWMPRFREAAMRGVRIDVLWGQDDRREEGKVTLTVLREARSRITAEGLDTFIQFHLASTQSHAKAIVADDQANGRFSAIVGSCNWLSTNFVSFDASIRMRDPSIVSDLISVLAQLSMGRGGHWTALTQDFARLAVALKNEPPIKGHKALVGLALGPGHGFFVRKARDEASKRIFVASHRLSEVADRAVVLPAVAAAMSERQVKCQIYFNSVSGGLTQDGKSDMVLNAGKSGIKLTAVCEPRLHAKILAWDHDSLVISSQNWLSADSSSRNPLGEVGIYVRGGNFADHVIQIFENARVA